METRTITPAEAWEEVERLKIDIYPNRKTDDWVASVQKPVFTYGHGAEPLEAVTNLLERIGETANEQAKEVANA